MKFNSLLGKYVTEDGEEIIAILLEFQETELVLKDLVHDYFNEISSITVEELDEGIEEVFGKPRNVKVVYSDFEPTMIICKNNNFLLVNNGNALQGNITTENLQQYGFNSLAEIVSDSSIDVCYIVLFTRKSISSHRREEMIHTFIPTPIIYK